MHEPVILLPGAMCDARIFMPQLMTLGAKRAITVAPVTGGDRIEEIASGLLDVLPSRFALMGLSMGGIVAMEILRRAPGRVTRIALINTNSLAETPQSAADYEPLIIKLRSGNMADAVAGFMPPENIATGPDRADILELLRDMAERLGPDAIIQQLRALQRRRDYQSTLRRCKVPALIMCGAHDGGTPIKRHTFMAELTPYAELAVIEGAGHLPVLEQPHEVNDALMAWLGQPFVLRSRVEY